MGRTFDHLDKGLRAETAQYKNFSYTKYVTVTGPNGRRLCKWCGTEVPPRRQVYCSKECDHSWNMMTSSSYARSQVEQRDKGVCAACGLDTRTCPDWRYSWWSTEKEDAKREWLKTHGYDSWHRTSLWEADHIIAVVDGGHALGLDNYQTLCVPCHKKKTAELAARRALERKRAKEAAKPPKFISQPTLDLEVAS